MFKSNIAISLGNKSLPSRKDKLIDLYDLDHPYFFPLPSTMLNNEFSAITLLENNNVVGVGVTGISLYDGYEWNIYIPKSSGLEFDDEIKIVNGILTHQNQNPMAANSFASPSPIPSFFLIFS